jgi:cytochrome c5
MSSTTERSGRSVLRGLRPLRAVALATLLVLQFGCGERAERGPGELTYQRFCFACHAAGAAGAPRIGNAEDWRPRLAQGRDVLLRHTIDGMSGMPPRGGCAACSDTELDAAIDYMLERSL